MAFAGLAVIFAGFVGGHGAKTVERQIDSVVKQANVQKAHVSGHALHVLADGRHNAKQVARGLHAEGVIVCSLIKPKGTPTLRVLVYDANGTVRTHSETALTRGALTPDDLDVLRDNLTDDVASLTHAEQAEVVANASPAMPDDSAMPKVTATPKIAVTASPKVAVTPKVAASTTPKLADSVTPVALASGQALGAAVNAASSVTSQVTSGDVFGAPSTLGSSTAFVAADATTETAPAPAGPAAVGTDAEAPAAAPDSVSADDIEAMTAGDSTELTATAEAPSSQEGPRLEIGAAGGVGITGRTFSPGPMTLPAYSTSPVGSLHLDAHVDPTRSTRIAVVAERTLGMTTQMGADSAPTTIGRWEAIASRTVVDGRIQLAPAVGVGRRTFTIDSEDQTRTPDSGYNYLILGANARMPVGTRIALRTSVAFEPVFSGTEPTEAAFGEASRWAFDVGAALEVRAGGPLVVRAAADYQRFSWTWAGAGERGAGGAVDAYPSASLAVGAEY